MASTQSPPLTPEEKKQYQAAARRAKGSKLAAENLAQWLEPSLVSSPVELEKKGQRWLDKLGDDSVRRLSRRLKRMADWELARAEQMRDAKASPWMLLKFVGATQDMEIDGPECRDTVYANVLQDSVKRKRSKGREALTKIAIPLVVVATVATMLTAGVGYVAPVVASVAGLDPTFAVGLWENWEALFSPVLEKADVLLDKDVVSAGVMFVLGAFWMWAHDSRITEDLRLSAAEREVPLLEAAIGFEVQGNKIQSAIRRIPPAQRILLSHLSSTDLRAFLLGSDKERIEVLREQRPPLMAEFKAILASRDRSWSAVLPTVRDLANVCLPKRWARVMNMPHPGEIDDIMASHWRGAAPRVFLDAPVDPAPDPSSVPVASAQPNTRARPSMG